MVKKDLGCLLSEGMELQDLGLASVEDGSEARPADADTDGSASEARPADTGASEARPVDAGNDGSASEARPRTKPKGPPLAGGLPF